MKALWLSTAPWGSSSYSILTQRTLPDIVRSGVTVHCATWYGLQGAPQNWPIRPRGNPTGQPVGTVVVYPSVNSATYGADVVGATYRAMQADVLITCMDIWVLPPHVTQQMRLASWLPVDHDPCPAGIVQALQPCIYPMSYTKWGAEVLAKAGIQATYVPCSADASVYLPGDKTEARAKLDISPTVDYLVTMVAANKDPSDRKGFGEALQGWAKFVESHPNALLYIHTHWDGPVNIPHLCDSLGIGHQVMRPDPLTYLYGMYTDKHMRLVYQASDLLLNPAKSEGFGLPILESQMCGTPVALSDFSSTDELLFAGWKIPGQKNWSIGADSWRLLVSVDGVVDALEAGYAERDNLKLRQQARDGARHFDTEEVFNQYWRPALKDIEGIVCGKGGELKLVTF